MTKIFLYPQCTSANSNVPKMHAVKHYANIMLINNKY